MWSVVTESPSIASTRAPSTSRSGAGSGPRSVKKLGSRTYVESGSHAKSCPVGASMRRQWSSPSQTRAYSWSYRSGVIACSMTALTSSAVGQMSRRYTGSPSEPVPSGSVSRSTSIVPARA
jgi:hypothetical protein